MIYRRKMTNNTGNKTFKNTNFSKANERLQRIFTFRKILKKKRYFFQILIVRNIPKTLFSDPNCLQDCKKSTFYRQQHPKKIIFWDPNRLQILKKDPNRPQHPKKIV